VQSEHIRLYLLPIRTDDVCGQSGPTGSIQVTVRVTSASGPPVYRLSHPSVRLWPGTSRRRLLCNRPSFHCPEWWREHWEKTGRVHVDLADSIEDGWKDWLMFGEAKLPETNDRRKKAASE
jgi:hypothetical protein